MQLKALHQQTIVITGASSGNGLATAITAVERGAAVVLGARNLEALKIIKLQLEEQGGRVAVVQTDVAKVADVERLAACAVERFGGFDSWINNAAAATYGTVEQVSIEDHQRVFDVNYFGTLHGCLVAAQHLRKRGGGAIINLGSILGDRAIIQQGPYSATKHAVQALTDALRMELEKERAGISVTLIKPGAINTPYAEHARNYMSDAPRLPPPLYDPALVADAVLFACSTPRRQLYVGGAGVLSSLIGQVAPRMTDRVMELIGTRIQQKPGDPGGSARRGNLYEPTSDGTVRGSQNVYVRNSSMALEAQTLPAGASGGIALGLCAYILALRLSSQRRKHPLDTTQQSAARSKASE
ncbi:SDR family oxidoreductase [Sphingomonas baiyangensis]|uniref:SDR family NAD(P)-dependent oxidoreductase n=1 Tax=Sphingomonas baiyangensis TaxID=2572576 RepID=A0A4U1L5R0_9SPHN|nr:SDR family oxidoreductase [Sphingomonas baiyangensis]TKD51546.1 SDR family NAD(P)-dependent oxidoreductase [Sphingomonas baiyangensis]